MAILGLVAIMIFIVPFVVMYYNRLKREKLMLRPLEALSKEHNSALNQHEFCGDFIIGMDENKNFVFFVKIKDEEVISQFVDLSDIQGCQVLKKTRSGANGNGNFALVESIELGFTSRNHGKVETKFKFYSDETNMQLAGEVQVAEKWSTLINNKLNNRK